MKEELKSFLFYTSRHRHKTPIPTSHRAISVFSKFCNICASFGLESLLSSILSVCSGHLLLYSCILTSTHQLCLMSPFSIPSTLQHSFIFLRNRNSAARIKLVSHIGQTGRAFVKHFKEHLLKRISKNSNLTMHVNL